MAGARVRACARATARPRVGAPVSSRQCNKCPEVLNHKQIARGDRERERGRQRDSNGIEGGRREGRARGEGEGRRGCERGERGMDKRRKRVNQ